MPVNIDGEIYEEVEDEYRVAVTYLLRVRDKLEIKDDTKLEGSDKNTRSVNKRILRYALEIYRVWGALYPQEHKLFIENLKEELANERPVKEAIKAGGYTPSAFPPRLEMMYSLLIPQVKRQDRRFWKPMFSSIPELKWSNYA